MNTGNRNVSPMKTGRCIHQSLCISFVLAALCAAAGEPIRWFNGDWDETGAPKGVLLSDNGGGKSSWWGDRVWTGVEYTYETPPTSPADLLGNSGDVFGRRLLDGRAIGGGSVPVGWRKGPLVVVFDFKRPCVFNEVDLVFGSGQWRKERDHKASLSFSDDGTSWRDEVSFAASNIIDRLRLDPAGRGRYMRLELAETGVLPFALDEVLVWGDGEVSEKYPEDAKPVEAEWNFPQSIRGNAKTCYSEAEFDEFAAGASNGVEIVALGTRPDKISSPVLGRTPESISLKMARNETESRFFAVVNATRETNNVAIAVEGLGGGVSAEMLVGGTILTSRKKRKLPEKEVNPDLQILGDLPEEMFDTRYDTLPFFSVDSRPSGILSRYVANREQVRGFPSAVPLRPGEAVVMMLRLKTDGAKPGKRNGVLTVKAVKDGVESSKLKVESSGATSLPLNIEVVDLMLPDPPAWVYTWGPFTSQFPFESKTRFERDVSAVADLGVTQWQVPTKGSKHELAMKMCPHGWFMAHISGWSLFNAIYCCSIKELTDEHRKHLDEHTAHELEKAKAMGIPPERVVFDVPDEIGPGQALIVGEVAKYVKSKHPEVSIFCNPVWGPKGFREVETMKKYLLPWYNEAVDISVPYRSHLEDKGKREDIFTQPRRVNAQYAQPTARAERSIAWSSFRYGLDGYAWWTYYSPTGNPWDIRTWEGRNYGALNVLPLADGVAVCPIYEVMREARDDWRLLTALREAGKTELLDSLLKEFADSFDRRNMNGGRPYRCDFLELRDKALGAFEQ